jgi:broad specificity phosphatase PhoE
MLTVYLLRHGETAYNADGNRYCGRTDIDLTPKGLTQAIEVFVLLKDKKIDAVYSSPLKRAKRTAEIATGRNVITDSRLIEVDFGNWEGKTKDEFIKEDPDCWQKWMEDPSNEIAGKIGESGNQVIKRVGSFFDEMKTKHQNQTIVVVAHNGVNRLYLASRLGMPLKNYRRIVQENSSITLFQIDGEGEFSLYKLNAK